MNRKSYLPVVPVSRGVLALLAGFAAVALRAGEISGDVFATGTNTALAGATVAIVESHRSVATDSAGRFLITDLPAGQYTVRITHLGYPDWTQTTTVPERGSVRVSATLGSETVSLQSFVVEGLREGRSRALQQKQSAQNLKEVISADSTGELPDRNVAEALSRVSGVNIDTVGSEGMFVTIRGIEPNYNSVTFNGSTLAAPGHIGADGAREGRATPLDVVSSAQVSEIEVIKAVTPDMDGNSLGGSIDIKTPSAFRRNGRILQGSAEFSRSEAAKKDGYAAEITWGDRFGRDKHWGLVAALNLSQQPYRDDGLSVVYRAINGTFVHASQGTFFPNSGERKRVGATLNLEFQPDDDTKLYLRAIGNRMEQEQTELEVNWVMRPPFDNGTAEFASSKRARYTESSNLDNMKQDLLNVSTGGSKKFGAFLAKWDVTYSLADDFRETKGALFRTPGDVVLSGTGLVVDSTGFYPEVIPNNLVVGDPTLLQINRYALEGRFITEQTWTPRVDLRWDTGDLLFGRSGFIQGGVKFMDRDRDISRSSRRIGGPVTLAEIGAVGPGMSVWDGQFYAPYTIDIYKAFDYLSANFPGPRLTENLVDNAQQEIEDTYFTTERILGTYLMAQANWTPKLTVLAGVRFEKTDVSMTSFESVVSGATGAFGSGILQGIVQRDAEFNYDSVLPNFQLKYQLADRQILRFSITSTFGRPPYQAAAAQGALNIENVVGGPLNPNFPFTGSVRTGNPGLQPYNSTNFDLSYEWYLRSGGLLSASVFYKAIENPIYDIRDTQFNVVYAGLGFEEIDFRTKANGQDGFVKGVELGIQLPFNSFLSGPLGGFGIDGNVTMMRSEATLNPITGQTRDLKVRFFRQPDLIYNAGVYYQRGRWTARVAYNFQGDQLRTVGAQPVNDTFQSDRGQLDFRVSFKFNKNYRISVSGQNVTDEPLFNTFGDGTYDAPKLRSGRRYGAIYKAGIHFNF